MPRLASLRETQAKIVKTYDRTVRTSGEIAETFGKTIATSEVIVKICGKTREPFVMTGNKCDRTSTQGQMPDNCNRTSKVLGATVKTCEVIAVTSAPIDRIGVEIVRTSERIARI